ncbi:MAG: exonuclease domain-containing protein [Chloroflexi bacterium]|nr:exonuclease domain-containing protein [Chloroflexota bacterium]
MATRAPASAVPKLVDFVALDVETTGLDPSRDRIIEIGAIRFTFEGVAGTYETLVDPGVPLPEAVVRITGIAPALLRGAPSFNAVRLDIEDFLGDAAIVGHNIAFDLEFLARAGIEPPGLALDTFEFSALLAPSERTHNLEAVAARLGVGASTYHRALADAETSRRVFLALVRQARALPPDLLSDLIALGAGADWPLAQLLRSLSAVSSLGGPPTPPRRRPATPVPREGEEASPSPAAPSPSWEGPPPSLEGDAGASPSPEEQIALALDTLAFGTAHPEIFGSFEQRPEQVGMTRAVATALAQSRHLVVEAGTGTGKTLAYLVPAALQALRDGQRVIVSTNTINLQEQVLRKDVPALQILIADAIGGEAAAQLRVTELKGRRNYLCRRRVATERLADANSIADAGLLARLSVWLRNTETGDRADLRLLPGEDAIWNRFSAESEDCLSDPSCTFVRNGTCFLQRARKRAEAAHVVVVNHALLLSDLAAGGSALPAADTVVVDEAHHLEDAATQHMGVRFGPESFREPLDRIQRPGPRGAPVGLVPLIVRRLGAAEAGAGAPAGAAAVAASLPALAARVDEALDALAELLRRFAADQADDAFGQERRLRLTSGRRVQPAWSEIEIQWEVAWDALRALDARLEALHDALVQAALGASELEALAADVEQLRALLLERAEVAGRLLTQTDDAMIVWLTASERTGAVSLAAAPLRVAERLAEEFFGRKRSVVLTGATLCTEGRFDYLRGLVGLDDADEACFGSPFDYRRAVRLLLPTDFPAPNEPGFQDAFSEALIDLVLASEGRALVLFTSHGTLRRTAKGVRGPLAEAGILTLAQGVDGSPARLVAELQRNPRALLLGSAALWEGVDLPGDVVSLVAIARLPFTVPNDPVFAARAELYEDSFREYALPQAIVRFRQGFGRLIRRRGDRGVIAVLDGRITSRRYGERFLRSLPSTDQRRVQAAEFGALTAEWLNR